MEWCDKTKQMIPKGWKTKRLDELGTLLMGQSPDSKSYNDDGKGYPLINGAAELQKDKVEINKSVPIKQL